MPADDLSPVVDHDTRSVEPANAPTGAPLDTPPDSNEVHPTCPQCGRAYRSGELACSNCGIVFENKLQTKPREEPEATLPTCYNCGKTHQPGALACSGCGVVFSVRLDLFSPEDTNDFSAALADTPQPRTVPQIGAVPFVPTTITFDIDGIQLLLPNDEVLVIGRGKYPEAPETKVDLGPFGAHDKGVSRRHLRLRRKGTLIYAADLGSTNGTWLNGQRLLPYGDRLLRSDDELKLSHLRLKVKYRPWEPIL